MRAAGSLRRGDVVEVLPVDVSLGVLGPGFRDLKLAQQSEFHLSTSRSDTRAYMGEAAGLSLGVVAYAAHKSPPAERRGQPRTIFASTCPRGKARSVSSKGGS